MKVKTTNTTDADQRSASLMFEQITKFFDTSDWKTLEMFARNGQLTLSNYAHHVEQADAWELGAEHYPALEELSKLSKTTGVVHIGCSYAQADKSAIRGEYDMIVIDTPQGLHKTATGVVACEHFKAIDKALPMLKDDGLIVLYCNKRPYNKDEVGSHGYDEYDEYNFDAWMKKRAEFYGFRNPTEGEILRAYYKKLSAQGYKVQQVMITPCYSDVEGMEPYAFRLAIRVKRK